MARRKKSTHIPGPKVWILAAGLALAGIVFGRDDPQMRATFFEMAERLLEPQPTYETTAGGVRIIDGDTLDLNGERIRLFGIDAPEADQTCHNGAREWRCGAEATRALAKFVGDQTLICEKRNTDRYGRTIAICRLGGVSVNTWMVRNGWAVAYRQYGGAIYDANEAAAKQNRLGVWIGDFTMPWDWRRTR